MLVTPPTFSKTSGTNTLGFWILGMNKDASRLSLGGRVGSA